MKDIPVALSNELTKNACFLCFLITFSFDTTLYYTNLDHDVYYDGITYNSRGMEFSDIQQSITPTIDSITFDIDNVELEFSSLSLNQELRGKRCEIKIAALDKPLTVLATSIMFVGVVNSIEINEQRCTFSIYDPFLYWRIKVPRRVHQSTCPWVFKGDICQYAGVATNCDRSYDRCLELGNTINFGGFRWIDDLQDRELWWGSQEGMPKSF